MLKYCKNRSGTKLRTVELDATDTCLMTSITNDSQPGQLGTAQV
jgi:hypothetical protein